MILDILTVPNEILKTPALPVEKFDNDLDELIKNMIETMDANDGAGLAANQIGILKQVFVFNEYKSEVVDGYEVVSHTSHALINPKITWSSKYKVREAWEGCLSIPDLEYRVSRPVKIKVAGFLYQDNDFKLAELEADGLAARTISHEMNHLQGILISDKSNQCRLKKDNI